MGYVIRYTWNIDYIPPGGMNALNKNNKPTVGGKQSVNAANTGVGGSTTFTVSPGNTVSGALSSSDVTTLANGAAADVNAQANALIAIMQNWAVANNGVW